MESLRACFVLPSNITQDLPEMLRQIEESVDILDFRDSIVPTALQRYLSFGHPVFSADQRKWDLPAKRNFALWHAARSGFRYILLLDDDIRGLTPEFLRRAGEALTSSSIVGGFVTEFPDTSVVGHIETSCWDRCLSIHERKLSLHRREFSNRYVPRHLQ